MKVTTHPYDKIQILDDVFLSDATEPQFLATVSSRLVAKNGLLLFESWIRDALSHLSVVPHADLLHKCLRSLEEVTKQVHPKFPSSLQSLLDRAASLSSSASQAVAQRLLPLSSPGK